MVEQNTDYKIMWEESSKINLKHLENIKSLKKEIKELKELLTNN